MSVWIVTLSDEDLHMINDITDQRMAMKARYRVRSEKYDAKYDDRTILFTGTVGEVGFARAIGVEPDWSVLIGGDDGSDLMHGKYRMQVKTPHGEVTKDWFYVNDMDHFRADIGVLCNLANERTVVVRGAIPRDQFIKKAQTKNWGYGERIGVPAAQLFSCVPVIRAIQKQTGTTVGRESNAY